MAYKYVGLCVNPAPQYSERAHCICRRLRCLRYPIPLVKLTFERKSLEVAHRVFLMGYGTFRTQLCILFQRQLGRLGVYHGKGLHSNTFSQIQTAKMAIIFGNFFSIFKLTSRKLVPAMKVANGVMWNHQKLSHVFIWLEIPIYGIQKLGFWRFSTA